MSIYHMMNGVNPMTFLILPMLGKHPDEYPRFRDVFAGDESRPEYDRHIMVYTRTGGGNRPDYAAENGEMMKHPDYVDNYDDQEDSTYAVWVFKVPEKWSADYDKIMEKRVLEVSDEYKDEMYRVYPKLTDAFNKLFGR